MPIPIARIVSFRTLERVFRKSSGRFLEQLRPEISATARRGRGAACVLVYGARTASSSSSKTERDIVVSAASRLFFGAGPQGLRTTIFKRPPVASLGSHNVVKVVFARGRKPAPRRDVPIVRILEGQTLSNFLNGKRAVLRGQLAAGLREVAPVKGERANVLLYQVRGVRSPSQEQANLLSLAREVARRKPGGYRASAPEIIKPATRPNDQMIVKVTFTRAAAGLLVFLGLEDLCPL